ncbi:hypothetical protein OG440_38905 (plasmid) [Streptomyces sp. NBC_00637]|uniref:hypothetical protein n=1 Tax=Streptomyces sp. NBC_00637 TaxID=2903667 RepID=UPI002F907910
MKCSAGIAVVSATVGALGLAASANSAQAATPAPGPTRSYTEQRIDPATGKLETARITEYPNTTVRPAASLTIAPAPGTGGLYLRNANGSVKGLMAEADQAEFLDCHPSDNRYVLVRQFTHGHGGWGASLGYITAAATMAPGQLPCHH